MKRILILLLMVLIISIFITGCGDDSDEVINISDNDSEMNEAISNAKD